MKVKGAAKVLGTPQTLGARIRAVRKSWGWTQEELATALGNDRQIVSYWERDKAKPTRSALQLLAQVFGISLEALTTGEGFEVPEPVRDSALAVKLATLRRALIEVAPATSSPTFQALELSGGVIKKTSLREARAFLAEAAEKGSHVWVIAGVLE